MTLTEARRVYMGWVARQRERDKSGHVGHIRCSCPHESNESNDLLDRALDVLPFTWCQQQWQ